MGHSVFGGMQRLNIEAARRQAGQDLLQTPNPCFPPSAGGSGTPISLNTPDILNSLIAITNPFFEGTSLPTEETSDNLNHEIDEPQEKKVFANLDIPTSSANNNANKTILISPSNTHNHGSQLLYGMSHDNGSPQSVSSDTSSSVNSPACNQHQQNQPNQLNALQTPGSSVQSMRSQLIKEGLKLTIQTKRKNSGKEELDVKSELVAKRPKREEVELTYDFSISNDSNAESPPPTKLTPEDEERRRRRRERNKVAATKCRNKKKEKTVLLVKEAEVLEGDNVSLKSEIAQMEEEYQRLSTLLAAHTPTCSINVHQQKPSTTTATTHHDHQTHQNMNMMDSQYSSSTTIIHQHDYSSHTQNLNPHLAISSSNSHNHFMGNNVGYNNFNQQMHHQPIQLS